MTEPTQEALEAAEKWLARDHSTIPIPIVDWFELAKRFDAFRRPVPQPSESLVERLRAEHSRNGGQGAYAWNSRELCGKAADTIEALCTSLADMTAQRDLAIRNFEHNHSEWLIMKEQLTEVTEKLEIAHGLFDCACGYDETSDLCLGHAHILAKRETKQLAEAKAALREARDLIEQYSEFMADDDFDPVIDRVRAALANMENGK